MAKQPRAARKTVDLGKMLPSLQELGESSDSCLGKEYDINTQECRSCADCALCLALYRKEVQAKIVSLLPLPLLDVADFSLLTDEFQQGIITLVGRYQDNGSPMKVMELFAAAKQRSNCPDDYAVAEWVKRFLLDSNLVTKDGDILRRS